MKKIKTAIVGLGKMGRLHLEKVKKHPDFEVCGLVDIENKNEFDEFVKNSQALIIATPTHTHLDYIGIALKVNPYIKILCEKPLCLISQIEKASKYYNNEQIMVGMLERHNNVPSRTVYDSIITKRSRITKVNNIDDLIDTLIHDLDYIQYNFGNLIITNIDRLKVEFENASYFGYCHILESDFSKTRTLNEVSYDCDKLDKLECQLKVFKDFVLYGTRNTTLNNNIEIISDIQKYLNTSKK